MSAFLEEQVLSVHHWTNNLFSFTTTRDQHLRFSNGHFTMIGLKVDGKNLLRAYSIVSPNYEEFLEFLSIKVENGPLTSRLCKIKVGDTILVGKKPTGTLLIDYLLPGKNLYLIGTGTGLAPWLAVARNPETYEKFDKVIVVHGVRYVQELAYRKLFETEIFNHEFLGEIVKDKLIYYPTVTREKFKTQGRISNQINENIFPQILNLPALNPKTDRIMLCGSPSMLEDLRKILLIHSFKEGNTTNPGDFVIERAFVEK